jgi:hypothetical protein
MKEFKNVVLHIKNVVKGGLKDSEAQEEFWILYVVFHFPSFLLFMGESLLSLSISRNNKNYSLT